MAKLLSISWRERNLRAFYGYYMGNIDNVEGDTLRKAYVSFQKGQGLATNGYGPITDTKLRECIKNLQTLLNNFGYKLAVDGYAGNDTINAISDFQRKNGLKVDGIAGEKTFAKLRSGKVNDSNLNISYTWDAIKHFKKSDFACKDGCGLNNIDLRVVYVLERIRNHFNAPIIVTSGSRCAKHNREVGGVQGSRHVLGKAIDFYVKGVSIDKVMAYTRQLVKEGVLRYTYTGGYKNGQMNGICHIDIN